MLSTKKMTSSARFNADLMPVILCDLVAKARGSTAAHINRSSGRGRWGEGRLGKEHIEYLGGHWQYSCRRAPALWWLNLGTLLLFTPTDHFRPTPMSILFSTLQQRRHHGGRFPITAILNQGKKNWKKHLLLWLPLNAYVNKITVPVGVRLQFCQVTFVSFVCVLFPWTKWHLSLFRLRPE